MKNTKLINFITKIAVFSAISIVLYYLKFPLPFFPSFLEIQFSTLPAILAGFAMGPIGGMVVVIIRFIVKLLSSHTFFIGELSDLIIGLSVVLSSSLFYRNHRSKKGGIIALVISVVIWLLISTLSNIFVIMPAYINAYGFDNVYGMLSNIKGINEDNYMVVYILLAVIPFNLITSIANCVITFFVYKKISYIFKKDFFAMNRKALIISSGFKGTLSSKDIGIIIKDELSKKNIKADYIPISDGGDGFLDTIKTIDNSLVLISCEAKSAINQPKMANYYFDPIKKIAYIELAEVVGIKDLKTSELSPYNANSYGLGMVIKHAITISKASKIFLGIGGSASTDVGCGMMEALGLKFYDANGSLINNLDNEKLPLVERIDDNDVNELIKNVEINVLTDVINPLVGPLGTVNVFSPQKGAKPEDLKIMESYVEKFADTVNKCLNIDAMNDPSTGAAGGVGYAGKVFLHANLYSGIDMLLNMLNFEQILPDYSEVITGEGCIDSQSLDGKVISGIMKYNPKRIIFVVGGSKLDDEYVKKHHLEIYPIVPLVASFEESMANPEGSLRKLIKNYYQ